MLFSYVTENKKRLGFIVEIKKMQDEGTIFIIARLDDEVGIQIGQDLSITVFQGFYIDRLLSKKGSNSRVT